MACCMSNKAIKEWKKERIQKQINMVIERQFQEDQLIARKTMDFLLLGPPQSGKSTFLRHMRIIHGDGYSDEDKKSFIKFIYQNIFMAMQSMIRAMDLLKIRCEDPANLENAELVQGVDCETMTTFEHQYVYAIRALWNDPGIQECYDRRREFHLIDSAKYYLSDLDRISSPDYLPTQEDILRVKVPSVGITEYSYDLKYAIHRIIDAGSLQSTRRKWDHCFQDSVVIFLAALTDYDEILLESDSENKMEKSKNLFKAITACRWFQSLPIILFLNKKDLLEEKIMVSHLVDYFPEFEGPKQDHVAARDFILRMYKAQSKHQDRIFAVFTCATDTENMRFASSELSTALLGTRPLRLYNLV